MKWLSQPVYVSVAITGKATCYYGETFVMQKGLDSRIYDVYMWGDNPISLGAMSLSL